MPASQRLVNLPSVNSLAIVPCPDSVFTWTKAGFISSIVKKKKKRKTGIKPFWRSFNNFSYLMGNRPSVKTITLSLHQRGSDKWFAFF